jgi:dihydrofolate reductase
MSTGITSRKVVYMLNVSVDGFIDGPNRELDWHLVDEDLHNFINEQLREIDTFLFGRRMYETMSFWDTVGSNPDISEFEREFARNWEQKLKIVYSSTLDSVQGNARLAEGDIAEEIAKLKSQPGLNIQIGGAGLAASAIEQGLIAEYCLFIHPVIVGAGTPLFPNEGSKVNLKLLETHTFGSGVVFLRYQASREG